MVDLDKARKIARHERELWIDEEFGNSFTALLGMVYESLNLVVMSANTACYAGTAGFFDIVYHKAYDKKGKEVILNESIRDRFRLNGKTAKGLATCFVAYIRKDLLDKFGALDYYDALINHSPFHDIYLTENSNQIKEDEFLLVDIDKPHNMVQGALAMVRRIWEYPCILRSYNLWRKYGASKTEALMLSTFSYVDGDGSCVSLWSDRGHTSFHIHESSVETFKRYLKKEVYEPSLGAPYRKYGTYNRVNELFPQNNTGKRLLLSFIDKAKQGDKSGVKSSYINPFAKTVVKVGPERSKLPVKYIGQFLELMREEFS